jgi:glycosyltransferase involved in cell wall biosynthesis
MTLLLPSFFSPPDLARHMQDSKILLCLSYSRYESLGLAAREAGACGCVVLFNVNFLQNVFHRGSFFSKMIKQRLTHSVAHGREQNLS